MKYAIVQSGSKQLRAEVGKLIEVDLLPKQAGDSVEFDVLLVADGSRVKVGAPTVSGAKVEATVVEHFRGEKIRIFKYKPKERQRKGGGHRQSYTRLKVEKIVG
ncbi:MAG: 50S ribosomal protein L21 [Chloroflexi bacterium]|nr:50S ribosomal protein L21 [Chloroflexota bacterium]